MNTILDQFPGNRVVAFDRNSDISFLGCGMALWLGGRFPGLRGCSTPVRRLLRKRALSFIWRQEVDRIDFDGKAVYARGKDGKSYVQEYDKLILAPGLFRCALRLRGWSWIMCSL